MFLRSWYPVSVPQLYNPVTSLLMPVGQKDTWAGMRTLGQLKYDLDIRNKPNQDSLYKVSPLPEKLSLVAYYYYYYSLLSSSSSTLSLNPYSRLLGKFDTSTPFTFPESCKRPSPSRTNPNRCRPKAKPRVTCRDRRSYESLTRKRCVLLDLSISVLHMSCSCNSSELFFNCHYTKTVLISTISLKLIHQGSLRVLAVKYHIPLIHVPGKYQDGLLANFFTNPL